MATPSEIVARCNSVASLGPQIARDIEDCVPRSGELLPPNPIDGLSLIGNCQLAEASVRLHEVMDWFAEQRLLDLEPAEPHDRPGFRDSIGYLGGKGRDAVADQGTSVGDAELGGN